MIIVVGVLTALGAEAVVQNVHERRHSAHPLIWDESEGDQEEYRSSSKTSTPLDEIEYAPGFADLPIEILAHRLKDDMRLSGELVITTAERLIPAIATRPPPLADTG